MGDRLTIGAFARLTGLSPKALRHYDAIGVLRPHRIDPRTGYRLYARDQVDLARRIRRLRELDVSLEDIHAIVDDPDQAAKRLTAHRRDVEAGLFRRQRILHRLTRLIDHEEETMSTAGIEDEIVTPEEERQLAVALFNHTWELLETRDRTPDQDDRMLHAAHASRFHWDRIGEPVNRVIGEWQCSRVYGVLGRAEPAAHHARRALELCEAAGIEGFYRAAAYEALTRAALVAGEGSAAARHEASARAEADKIDDPEEREILEQDMASLPR